MKIYMRFLLLLIIAVAVPFFANAIAEPATPLITSDGLVGYWPFEGDAEDKSGYGNNGDINGATFVGGKRGQALKFRGEAHYDHVAVPDNDSIEFPDEFTINAWVTIDHFEDSYTLVSKWGPGGNAAYIFSIGKDGLLWLGTHNGVNSTWVSSDARVTPGGWHNIAVSYKDNAATFYLDGIKNAEKTGLVSPMTADTSLLNIGMGASRDPFMGTIDEVRMYNRALSDRENFVLYKILAHR